MPFGDRIKLLHVFFLTEKRRIAGRVMFNILIFGQF